MVELNLEVSLFKKYVKVRYPLLTIVSIILLFIIPYFGNYEEFIPYRSVDNTGEFGHSKLIDSVSDYKTDIIKDSLKKKLNVIEPSNKLLIIIAPEFKYSLSEKNLLRDFIYSGGNIFLLGVTPAAIDLAEFFNLYVDASKGKIYDRQNNYQSETGLIDIIMGGNTFLSVTPYSVNIYDYYYKNNYSNYIKTSPQSITEQLIINNRNLTQSYNIGIFKTRYNYEQNTLQTEISYIADNWLLSNKFIDIKNTNFMQNIIKEFETITTRITEIIFEESHYDYLPSDKVGVTNLFYRHVNNIKITVILLIFAIIGPLIFANKSGLLTDLSEIFSDHRLSRRIGKRLETLHLAKLPAVPLTEEERFLIEHKLEMLQRKKYYFQYVANNLLSYIDKENLTSFLTPRLIEELKWMRQNPIIEDEGWMLIIKTNKEIQKAEKSQLDFERDYL